MRSIFTDLKIILGRKIINLLVKVSKILMMDLMK